MLLVGPVGADRDVALNLELGAEMDPVTEGKITGVEPILPTVPDERVKDDPFVTGKGAVEASGELCDLVAPFWPDGWLVEPPAPSVGPVTEDEFKVGNGGMMLLPAGDSGPVGPLGTPVGWIVFVELDMGKGNVLPVPTSVGDIKLPLAEPAVEGDVVTLEGIP